MDTSDSEGIARHPRSIVHVDVDCFYAQVETLRHPEFDGKPLGVQQKNIVVTGNYLARQFGIGKCMSVQEALRLCPGLALVRGEDLTEYKRVSARISEILHQFTPLVERLGMDESFIDVSSVVQEHENDRQDNDCLMKDGGYYDNEHRDKNDWVIGKIFGPFEEECPCGCHARLATASRIAADMRARIFKELHLTCSAGIGHNKLVAKLAGSLNKPDQQTLVYPCAGPALLTKIGPISKIPGIGLKTTQLLAANDIRTVEDVRQWSLNDLESKIGSDLARKLKDSAEGMDDSVVKPSGKPQSIGIEDGFKHVSLVAEVESRLSALLRRLTDLATEDGRIPVAIKVTVRKLDLNKLNTGKRETRQCALPQNLLLPTRGGTYDHGKLLALVMKLFHRAVDVSKPFHLTLLGVAFTKFEERVSGRSSITSFLRKQVAVQSVLDISSEEGISVLPSASVIVTGIPTVATMGASMGRDVTGKRWLMSDVGRAATPPLVPNIAELEVEGRNRDYSHYSSPHQRTHHHYRHFHQSVEEKDPSGDLEPSPKKTKLEVWLSGRKESPSNEMASLRLGPSSPISPISPPPGTDPTVFKSLPINLQTEIGRSWPTTSKPKPNDILKYFIANK